MPGYEVIGNEELAQIKEIFDSGGILLDTGLMSKEEVVIK